jgi:hypothetical protein
MTQSPPRTGEQAHDLIMARRIAAMRASMSPG